MPRNPVFDLFESLCRELQASGNMVYPDSRLPAGLADDLIKWSKKTDRTAAFDAALNALVQHFQQRGSRLPFTFDTGTRQFAPIDPDYIAFIVLASDRRGTGADSAEFETASTNRLARRLTGALHRVGWERSSCRLKREFVQYLCGLGFDKICIEGRDKDGGLDILWLPPLGTIPLRPIIPLQCKNSVFDERDANSSVGRATRTLQRHSQRRAGHTSFVLFNDYIDDTYIKRAVGLTFVPLGLSDLGEPAGPVVELSVL